MATPERASTELVGQIVAGRYRIVSPIGEGGMGVVYRAEHASLSRPFAVKVLGSGVSSDAEVLARFRREARLVSTLRHPNIVDVVDWNVLPDGSPCMVMEFLEGVSLYDRLIDGPMSWSSILRIADELLAGLSAAHSAQIVHRDLKPHNVFLAIDSAGGEYVKILDFGISKLCDTESLLTTGESLLGTPRYMAPEQADGRSIDATLATDVWAMGVILYEMATGRPAFEATNLAGTVSKILFGEPPALSGLRPDASPEFCSMICRALAKDPKERYANASEMRAVLARLRERGTDESLNESAPTELWDGISARNGRAQGPDWEVSRPASGGGLRPDSKSSNAATMLGPPGAAAALPGIATEAPATMKRSRRSRWPLVTVLLVALAGAAVAFFQPLKAAILGTDSQGPAVASASVPTGVSTDDMRAPQEQRVEAAASADSIPETSDQPAEPPKDIGASDSVSQAHGGPLGDAAKDSATGETEKEKPSATQEIITSKVTITTTPEGALVKRGSKSLGRTPLTIERRKSTQVLSVIRAGYRSQKIRLSPDGPAELYFKLKPRRGMKSSPRKTPSKREEGTPVNPFGDVIGGS
jgi:serine/threonine-protein kinase